MSQYAILFADVVGSSALYKQMGDQAAKAKVGDCLAQMAQLTQQHDGTVIKTIGDEIMCSFEQAEQAALCAIDIQKRMQQNLLQDLNALAVRIGLHYGNAIVDHGDIFGDAVNTAARMTPIANGQQIITTQDTVDALSPHLQQSARPFDNIKIKAFSHNTVLFMLDWAEEEQADATMLSTDASLTGHQSLSSMFIKWGDYRSQIQSDLVSFVIGRDAMQCDLAIPSQFASRKHVWIEFRRGKFVLIDHSTNGTYVETQDGKQVYLRREELPLWGQGLISLGQPVDNNREQCIGFVIND